MNGKGITCAIFIVRQMQKKLRAKVEGARPRGRPKKTWRDCGKRLSGM